MRYPIAIEQGAEATAFGVVVPDLPGCFSAGDSLDEALTGAKEAATAWIHVAVDSGQPIPGPSSLDALSENPDFAGWLLGVIDLDEAPPDDSVERVQLSLKG